ncbi:MAG: cadmium-containing carbonic anhydrase [Microgenomates group bacterium]|jgi:hypothetical protein
MAIELIKSPGFDPFIIGDVLAERGWKTEQVKVSNVDLVPTDEGAAAECGDGRFGILPNRKKYGPAIFGGVNAICALKTGGDWNGFMHAAEDLRRLGFTPGTHGAVHHGEGCGQFGLWKNGLLESAIHSCSLPFELMERIGSIGADGIKAFMEILGGKHFRLPGEHEEEALRWNPFIGLTERAFDGSRFRNDDWLLEMIGGILLDKRINYNAEVVEKLKPDCKKVEILIP